MKVLLTFLEGLFSFISPCTLSLLPVFLSFFISKNKENVEKINILRILSFIIGYTSVFILLGIFAGTLGSILYRYKDIMIIISSIIIIISGLFIMGVIKININYGIKRVKITNCFSAFVFGVIYSLSLTPCTGAYLGTALILACNSGTVIEGAFLLFAYSMGFCLPFFISSIIIDKLTKTLSFIKQNYKIINIISGTLLIINGIILLIWR